MEADLSKKRNLGFFDAQAVAAPALDQQQIVEAAIALLNESGLDGFSMRRLADRLGIKAASLYWHVQDKDHLLILIGEAICATIGDPDPALSWRERAEWLGNETRRAAKAVRDGAKVLANTPPIGPNRLRLMNAGFQALLDAGFSPHDAVYAAMLVNDYVTMFVIEESYFYGESSDQTAAADYFASIPADQYPAIAQLAKLTAGLSTDADERFAFGGQVLLDGLEQQLARSKH